MASLKVLYWSPNRDHPRVCGEHTVAHAAPLNVSGSSPRMRGAHGRSCRSPQCVRIIPAYAGSTCSELPPASPCADHPRVCGEHRLGSYALNTGMGSSPRMRGALLVRSLNRSQVRIIPAYAGSTIHQGIRHAPWEDHPRVCGEHGVSSHACMSQPGSSPRMRGAHGLKETGKLRRRIIPAYAGSTSLSLSRVLSDRDHPRVCGEHRSSFLPGEDPFGSSPRMRGAQARRRHQRPGSGIIPAYAGSTIHNYTERNNPRGSSPRMRGALPGDRPIPAQTGIIPAYAGSTRWR